MREEGAVCHIAWLGSLVVCRDDHVTAPPTGSDSLTVTNGHTVTGLNINNFAVYVGPVCAHNVYLTSE